MVGRLSHEEASRIIIEVLGDRRLSFDELTELSGLTKQQIQYHANAMIHDGRLFDKITLNENNHSIRWFSLEPIQDVEEREDAVNGETIPFLPEFIKSIEQVNYFDMKDFFDTLLATAFGKDLAEFQEMLPEEIKKQMNVGELIIKFVLEKLAETTGLDTGEMEKMLKGDDDE